MRTLVFVTVMLVQAALVRAEVRQMELDYEAGGTVLKGSVAFDDELRGKRPGVLVIHEWWGLNDYPLWRAGQLAELGYVALAVDMYGDGKTTSDPAVAGAWAGEVRGNRALLLARLDAARSALARLPEVDPERIAAIGYCFGGGVALEAVRGGLPLTGVVSFHGSLATKEPVQRRAVRTKVLVLTGAADPFVPSAEVAAFEREMTFADADWQVTTYGGAVHAFTNPDAGKAGLTGVAYDPLADARSFEAMRAFLAEVLR